VVGPILAYAELDLVHPLQASGLVQPARYPAVRLQAYVVDALIAVNVGELDTEII